MLMIRPGCHVAGDRVTIVNSILLIDGARCPLGLGLENKSPQIELLRSEPSSSHHIVTIYSSIAHKIKSWICGIGLKDFGRQDQKLIQMQIVP